MEPATHKELKLIFETVHGSTAYNLARLGCRHSFAALCLSLRRIRPWHAT